MFAELLLENGNHPFTIYKVSELTFCIETMENCAEEFRLLWLRLPQYRQDTSVVKSGEDKAFSSSVKKAFLNDVSHYAFSP